MRIRFIADASLSEAIVSVMRAESSIDFLDANTAELESVSDDEVLAIAARENRILVTHDLKTMPSHFAAFLSHSQSPGVLLSQKTSVADAIDALLMVWLAAEAEEWINRICRLPL